MKFKRDSEKPPSTTTLMRQPIPTAVTTFYAFNDNYLKNASPRQYFPRSSSNKIKSRVWDLVVVLSSFLLPSLVPKMKLREWSLKFQPRVNATKLQKEAKLRIWAKKLTKNSTKNQQNGNKNKTSACHNEANANFLRKNNKHRKHGCQIRANQCYKWGLQQWKNSWWPF